MADLAYYLRISNHLAGNIEIKSALRSVKSEIEKIIIVDHLDVCLMDELGYWNTSYEVGINTSWGRRRTPVEVSPIRDILNGEVDHMITANAQIDDRYVFEGSVSEPIFRHDLKSRVNVAMKVLGQTIGSLNCSSCQPDYYDAQTIGQVRNIADILAPYFYALRETEKAKKEAVIRTEIQAREEGLRQGALSLTEALELERKRIGMDLHDQTLADLTRIARDVHGMRSPSEIKELEKDLQACIQGLRDIIDTSIPSLLELFGFQHAVRTHLERAIGSGDKVEIDVVDTTDGLIDRLPERTRIALYRIAQEAINNAVKHADASRIEVCVRNSQGILLTISDDGSGPPAVTKPSGGLTHMRTRARLIAAEFSLDRDAGTTVRVHLPENAASLEGPRP